MSQPLAQWTLAFDLDGTLIDTAPDLLAAMNHALNHAGYSSVPDEIGRGCIGNGAKAMLRAGLDAQNVRLDEEPLTEMWGVFLDHYVDNIVRHSRPFPGCLDALDLLADLGARLAVCTNKTQKLADLVLTELGLHSRFTAVMGADSVPAKKPDGDHIIQTVLASGGNASHAVMIGDSDTDASAARNAGLPLVFVNFGYGPEPEHDDKHHYRADDYDAVTKAIQKIAVVNRVD